MRLIDADALLAKYDAFHVGQPGRARKLIEDAPTVDAEPVRHGRWIKLIEASEWDQRRCSICGDMPCCQRSYCPHCGAKMDGE